MEGGGTEGVTMWGVSVEWYGGRSGQHSFPTGRAGGLVSDHRSMARVAGRHLGPVDVVKSLGGVTGGVAVGVVPGLWDTWRIRQDRSTWVFRGRAVSDHRSMARVAGRHLCPVDVVKSHGGDRKCTRRNASRAHS